MNKFPKKTNYGLSLWEDDLFDELFSFPAFKGVNNKGLMKTDIIEKEGNYVFKIDIPGVSKEDVKVEFEEGYLDINLQVDNSEKEIEDKYIRKERYYGSCSRKFYVGEIDESKIAAVYKDGTLQITIPKEKEEKKEKKKIINIK